MSAARQDRAPVRFESSQACVAMDEMCAFNEGDTKGATDSTLEDPLEDDMPHVVLGYN